MATANDFHGTIFTVQSLCLHHDMTDCEIVVIDNAPTTKHGEALKKFFMPEMETRRYAPVRYISLPGQAGTTQSRETIFKEARGDAVLVTDCHVLFTPMAISRLKKYYEDFPDCKDINSGPMILDHLQNVHTHFNNQWRGGMLGVWGSAWKCSCKTENGKFTTIQHGDDLEYVDLASSTKHLDACPSCGKVFPVIKWAGHEKALADIGCQPLGMSDKDPPFEIPGMGLGSFSCLKKAWPGFNSNFRGFGGEELFIHEKFRQRGGRAMCLPFLRWWHRFARPDGLGYVNRRWDRVRNYVLGHLELGIPLDELYNHFVSLDFAEPTLQEHLQHVHGDGPEKLENKSIEELEAIHRGHGISEEDWNYLIKDPVKHVNPKSEQPGAKVSFDTGRPQPPVGSGIDAIFEFCKGIKRDLDEHLPTLKFFASKVDHVTEFTKRRESTVAFVAARPKTVISYQKEADVLLATLQGTIKNDSESQGRKIETLTIHWNTDSLEIDPIEETDLLYIDTVHAGPRLSAELEAHGERVRRFIVLRGTGAFGERAESSEREPPPGLFHGLRPWLEANPQWAVIAHVDNEYGLTILSKNDEDKPPTPVYAWSPGFGPGTQLKNLLAKYNITPSPSCDCNAKALQMDKWGIAGCKANRETIIGWLREGAPRWNWTEHIAKIPTAVMSGLAFKINRNDPFPGIVDECIRLAEQDAKK
jgi:hypothetical protein